MQRKKQKLTRVPKNSIDSVNCAGISAAKGFAVARLMPLANNVLSMVETMVATK